MRRLLDWFRRPDQPDTAGKPLREKLLSAERLVERAVALAASLTIDPDPRRRSRDTFPRFEDNVRVLGLAYRTLAGDVRTGQFVAPAADWLLDNFHLVTAEITEIRRNLPRTYYRTLPSLAPPEHHGHARIYTIAVELIRHSDSRLDRAQLARRQHDGTREIGKTVLMRQYGVASGRDVFKLVASVRLGLHRAFQLNELHRSVVQRIVVCAVSHPAADRRRRRRRRLSENKNQ